MIDFVGFSDGYRKQQETGERKRLELAKAFQEFQRQNPTANPMEFQAFIDSMAGGSNYLRGGMPSGDMLKAITDRAGTRRAQEDRDRKFDISITKIIKGKKEIITKQVLKRKYNIQRIDGLAESKVTPPESVYKRIKKENNAIGEARAINSDLIFFKEKFIMPVEGIISGVYGSQRILNGKPRWPHYGIDIAAKLGTMIKSSGAGIVTMAEDDLYYTGGTIIMDHGHGISTIYSHLENVLVSVGDKINQGDVIGTVGSTGRSTGPHLDFRINWFQTRLDPMSVLK